MFTAIESYVFVNQTAHGVTEFALTQGRIRLKVAPWGAIETVNETIFEKVIITSVAVYNSDVDELNLPWDILGLDCYPLADNRWSFVLHCDSIEYGFEAEWPVVHPSNNSMLAGRAIDTN